MTEWLCFACFPTQPLGSYAPWIITPLQMLTWDLSSVYLWNPCLSCVEPSFCNYFFFLFVFVLCLFLRTQVSDLFLVSKQSHSGRWFGVILCWVCSEYSISCAPNSYLSVYLFLAGCQFPWKLEPWLILCIPSVHHSAWRWYLVSEWMDGWGVENKQLYFWAYFNIIFYAST